nr:hypothetical protein [uncultured Bacteroides sp.]
MENKYVIDDFFDISYKKNGNVSIKFKKNASAIELIIKELNFYHYIVNNKKIFFKKDDLNFVSIDKTDIRDGVVGRVKKVILGVDIYPEGCDYESFIQALYDATLIISQRLMPIYCPYIDLNNEEKHAFLMKYDQIYKSEYIKDELLAKFIYWGMKEKDDVGGTFSLGKKLFYKAINKNEYLIFCFSLNDSRKHIYIFDSILASFKSENDIGVSSYLSLNPDFTRNNFILERDYNSFKELME